MLKERINKDYESAVESQNEIAKNLLSNIKKEIQRCEKNTGVENLADEDVIEIINVIAKYLRDTRSILSPEHQHVEELAVVEVYLPKKMDTFEIRNKIEGLIHQGVTNPEEIKKAFAEFNVDENLVLSIYESVINEDEE